ncbi:hypothetical protein [Streptomyces sp. TLI_146]|uniref:hypothetical protein n=1 Tax=Streptomyces sp. TLI_146 TaxID=1938858 RepID=UPI000C70E4B9|nr:hypothetical protein [Streptomyces sp. TLI_146]PKV86907.1 hypothetical protein BX283_4489 [Streptomyces sp. TLI_146]
MPRTHAPHRRLAAVLLMVLGVVTVLLCGPSPAAASGPPTQTAVSVLSDSPPGCKQGGKQDKGGDPAAPVRARTAYDQAPAVGERIAPAALAAQAAEHRTPPVRGPTLAAPTPVELSVLRV